eukprot:199065_1
MRFRNNIKIKPYSISTHLQSHNFCSKDILEPLKNLNKEIRKLAKTNWYNEHSTQIVQLYEQLKQNGTYCEPATYFATQNALIQLHCHQKHIKEAENVWIELIDDSSIYRDSFTTFTCTAMMKIFRGYDYHKMVLRIFDAMPRLCLDYDVRCYRMAISATAKLKWKHKAKEIHQKLLDNDPSFITDDEHILHGLMNMYFKCGDTHNAQQLWQLGMQSMDKEQHIHMLTVLMSHYIDTEQYQQTLDVFDELQNKNVTVTPTVYNLVIQAITGLKSLERLERANNIYRLMQDETNIDVMSNVKVMNAVISMFGKCGDIEQTNAIWNDMIQNNSSAVDVVTCNTTMNANLYHDKYDQVLEIFNAFCEMCKDKGFQHKGRPNNITYIKCITAIGKMTCTNEERLRLIREVQSWIINDDSFDMYQNTIVCCSLIYVYSITRQVQGANEIWSKLKNKTTSAFASIVDCNYYNDAYDMVLDIYDEWNEVLQTKTSTRVHHDTKRIYLRAIHVCTHTRNVTKGKEIHVALLKMYGKDTIHAEINHALIKMYSNCGDTEGVECVWKSMAKSVLSYNVMIAECIEHKQYEKAFELFDEMQNEHGLKPISTTYMHMLTACNDHKALVQAMHHHIVSQSEAIGTQRQVTAALIDAYGRCGDIATAQEIWDTYIATKQHSIDLGCCRAIVTAYADSNQLNKAWDLFNELKTQHPQCADSLRRECTSLNLFT